MEFNFVLKHHFACFLKKSKRVPTKCMHSWGEQIVYDARDKKFTIIKVRETYVLSIKIGHFGLTKWTSGLARKTETSGLKN
jgi:hypothetical protein